jgi:putative membrane protein
MMKRVMTCAALVAIGVYLSLPGMAIAKDSQVSITEQIFTMMAAGGGLEEVHLGKLAADQAASPEVKQLAQRLVEDHTKANQELLTIAEKKDIAVQKELDDMHEDVVELFSKLEGAAFDREYVRYQVMHHEIETAAFAVQAKEGEDPDLKAFAAKHLPILQGHLQLLRELVAQQPAAGKPGETAERRGIR